MKIDVNSADRDDLLRIDGIGPGRADTIVQHRESLGRFRDLDQVMQLPHFLEMPEDERERIRAQLMVRAEMRPGESPEKIDVNHASREELTRVDGIGEGRANEIVRYREEHGGFRALDELDYLPDFRDMNPSERDAVKGCLTLG